jgi:hypothetical protein
MDFIQGLDPSRLVLAETVYIFLPDIIAWGSCSIAQVLSFLISPFTSPPYNLAIFLFGVYAQENTEGVQALQTVNPSGVLPMLYCRLTTPHSLQGSLALRPSLM